jgi:hypothetical protein
MLGYLGECEGLMSKWAIRRNNEIIWWSSYEQEEQYDTEEEAYQALIDEVRVCQQEYEHGNMEDAGDFEGYRIVEVV